MPGRVPVSGLHVYARVDARVRRGRRDLLQRGVRRVRQGGGALPGRVSLRLGAQGVSPIMTLALICSTFKPTLIPFVNISNVLTEYCHQNWHETICMTSQHISQQLFRVYMFLFPSCTAKIYQLKADI